LIVQTRVWKLRIFILKSKKIINDNRALSTKQYKDNKKTHTTSKVNKNSSNTFNKIIDISNIQDSMMQNVFILFIFIYVYY